jgi:hypothetical protein
MEGVEKDLRNLGVGEGWLEKVFRAGQDPQRVLMPIIILNISR